MVPEEPARVRRSHLWVALLLGLTAGLAYVNTLPAGFVYDDRHQVLENPWIRDIRFVPDILLKSVWAFLGPGYNSAYYRPVMHLTYMFEYHVFGLSSIGFHLVNVFLHAIVTIVVFALILAMLREAGLLDPTPVVAASSGALVFAVHPIHSEVVAWVASIPELTFSLLCLLSFACDRWEPAGRGRRAFKALAVLLFFFAMLAKETALVLPVLIFVHDLLFRKGTWIQRLRRCLPYAGAGVVYAVLRSAALGAPWLPRTTTSGPLVTVSLWRLPGIFVEYLRWLVWPSGLNAFRLVEPSATSSVSVILACLLLALLAGTAIFLRRREPLACLGLTWVLVPLTPPLAVAAALNNVISERYDYFPSVGLALLVALAVSRGWHSKLRWLAVGTVAAAAVLGLTATLQRNVVWRSELSLWTDTVGKTPGSSVVQEGFGGALLAAGHVDDAIAHYRLALSMSPDMCYVHLNLGLAYIKKGWLAEAAEEFLEALRIWPEYPKAHYSLGLAYLQLGKTQAGIDHLEAASRIWPHGGDANRELGNLYASHGLFDQAIHNYRIALQRAPWDADAHNGLGAALARTGRLGEGLIEFERASYLRPEDVGFRQNIDRVRKRMP